MADVPDFYIDGARVNFGIPGVTLILLRSRPTASQPQEVVVGITPEYDEMAYVRMSPVMTGQLVEILTNALKTLTEQAADQLAARGAGQPAAAPPVERQSEPQP